MKRNKKTREKGRTPEAGLLATNVDDDDLGRTADVHLDSDVNVGAQQSGA